MFWAIALFIQVSQLGEYKGRIDLGLGIIANIDIKAPTFIQFMETTSGDSANELSIG